MPHSVVPSQHMRTEHLRQCQTFAKAFVIRLHT